jgi:arylsulfatase A-like enzyme
MEYFYGFMGAETNQWNPGIYENTTRIEPPDDPKYHFAIDMTDRSISWMKAQHSLTPDKPFFLYYASGATHAPHHVPKEWIARYKGKFDQGWDKVREETLERQQKLGIVPANTKLAAKPQGLKDWDKLTPQERQVFARQMEVYAAYSEFADAEVGRLVKAIDDEGLMDNTLFLYILGDNGGSPEGGVNGAFSELSLINNEAESIDVVSKVVDQLGGPTTYNHYAVAWAVAADAPFSWHKEIAANFGGTRNGLIVRWPARVKDKGGMRTQFTHLIDVAPTILEAAGLPEPKEVNGIKQRPMEGVSMLYTFDDSKAKERHTTQYFEILGSRGIYHDGWVAGTVHHANWQTTPLPKLADDRWELYNVAEDFSEANDLAAQNPAKLKELQDLFMKEAEKYHVLPIDDRGAERLNAALAGRPDLMQGRTSLTVYDGAPGMMENAFINVKNRSHVIAADVEIPNGGADGVILCQAGRFGGWSLYLKGGKPTYRYNWLGREQFTIAADEPVPAGKATIRFEFAYDGGGIGKGGKGVILVNGKQVASGRIEKTHGYVFSGDETADVGRDTGTPVSEDYTTRTSRFTGKINKVTVEIKPQKNDVPQPKPPMPD